MSDIKSVSVIPLENEKGTREGLISRALYEGSVVEDFRMSIRVQRKRIQSYIQHRKK